MSRVRRRIARDRLHQEPSEARRRHWRWRSASLRRRVEGAMLPPGHPDRDAAMAEGIRNRMWSHATWDRLRASGLSPAEAREVFSELVPPWWDG